MGLDGLQYCEDLDRATPEQVLACASRHNQRILAVDPFNCGPPSPDDASEAGAWQFYRRVIDLAKALGRVPATLQGLPQWMPQGIGPDRRYGLLVRMVRALNDYASQHGVPVVYEAVNRYESTAIRTAAEGMQLLSDAGVGHPALVLDSFHMHIEETDPVTAIRSASGKLASYHISDSNRGAVGAGQVDFVSQHHALTETGFDGLVMIELVLPNLVPSTAPVTGQEQALLDKQIAQSRERWLQFARR
jgi:sugar phosphate isomerase/epimerase